jgi:hypothetical protein
MNLIKMVGSERVKFTARWRICDTATWLSCATAVANFVTPICAFIRQKLSREWVPLVCDAAVAPVPPQVRVLSPLRRNHQSVEESSAFLDKRTASYVLD